MQSIDEILIDITSRTEGLIRKLKELRMENEILKKENRQLKQEVLAKKEVDLFSSKAVDIKELPIEAQDKLSSIRKEVDECIQEVKDCIVLAGER